MKPPLPLLMEGGEMKQVNLPLLWKGGGRGWFYQFFKTFIKKSLQWANCPLPNHYISMKTKISQSFLLFLILFLVFSCDKEKETTNTVNPLDGNTKLYEGYALGAAAKVEIWGAKNYFTGYNKLKVVVYDSLHITEKITDAQVSFYPEMTMKMSSMTVIHTAPVENPVSESVNGVFEGVVVFQMPSTADGTWKLDVKVINKNGKTGKVTANITVDNPTNPVCKAITTTDNISLIVAMVKPINPQVGVNDFELTIHKKVSMMQFPNDDSYTVEITPEMPSMGHGSPNNVNPVLTTNGHYLGKVNFTMTGTWRINVLLKKNDQAVSSNLYFDITF